MKSDPITNYIITPHAMFEMKRRGLNEEIIDRIITNPEQRIDVRSGRVMLQSQVPMERPKKMYLVRVFIDINRTPAEVVTVYRTSKISKYWKEEL